MEAKKVKCIEVIPLSVEDIVILLQAAYEYIFCDRPERADSILEDEEVHPYTKKVLCTYIMLEYGRKNGIDMGSKESSIL